MKIPGIDTFKNTAVGERLRTDRAFRILLAAAVNMGWNFLYGLFCGGLGLVYRSGWFCAMAAYHLSLGLLRLIAVESGRAPGKSAGRKILLGLGVGLMVLAVILSVIVRLTIADSVGRVYPIAVMISIAALTFYTVIRAVVNMVRAHRKKDQLVIMLRNISCASAVGSILSLERSMLGTFGSSTSPFTYVMEGVSGLVGFLIVLSLGIAMILGASRAGEKRGEE